MWAYWNFLVFSQSSPVGSFCLSFWCFCSALCINRAPGHLAESILIPHWPSELERLSPVSPTNANSLESGWCLCESGGCAEWVAVPQPAARQRWTVPDPSRPKQKSKVFHDCNEWLRRYLSLSQMRQSSGATKTQNQSEFWGLLCLHWQALCSCQPKSSTSTPQRCCIASVCARAVTQQAADLIRSVSLCTPTQGSLLAFQTAAGN